MAHTNFTANKPGLRKGIVHGCAAVLFIAFCFSLNPIFARAFGSISEAEQCFPEKDEVFFYVDDRGVKSGLSESVYLAGWALCETEQPNDSKEIWVVFFSEKKSYAIQAELTDRPDVTNYYADDKNVQGSMHGFKTEFSTLSMPSGTYDICLYCRENDENYGLQPTTLRLRKNGRETVFLEAWE